MAKIYYLRVCDGTISIDQVPALWRDAVQALLDADMAQAAPTDIQEDADSAVSILDGMTVAQLKEYAATNGVNLSGIKLKADILAAVKAAEEDMQ